MIDLGAENFEAEVLKSDKPVIVDYWSDSCGPCKELLPDIENLSKKYNSKIKFCKLNIKGNRRLAISQQVMSLPSIVFYKDGAKKEHLTGDDLSAEQIEEALKAFLNT